MKLLKKSLSVLALLFVVFAMTGCAELLGKLKNDIDQIPGAETPSVDYEGETDVTIRLGGTATLSVKSEVSDGGKLSYQWYKSSTSNRNEAEVIPLAVTSKYIVIASLNAEDDGKVEYYWCKVVNLKNAKTSEEWSTAFKVTIQEPTPETPIIKQEENYSFKVHYSEPITFSVNASVENIDPTTNLLSYQWYSGTTKKREEAKPIEGTTDAEKLAVKTPIYASFAPSAPEKDGEVTYYWCKVTNKNIRSGKTIDAWSEMYDVTVSNIIRLNGKEIKENTTWESKYTYFVENWVEVKASLTIPKGTVVKFKNGAYMETSDSGMIKVEGSVTDEKKEYVYFTSYLDHAVGITIPEYADSAATVAKGDWNGVYINGENASKIEYAVFRYSNVALELNNEKTNTVENCIFTDNQSNNVVDNPSAALIIKEPANKSTVKNNIFYNNDWPLRVSANYTVDPSNIFHNPEVTDRVIKNVHQAIVMEAGKEINTKNISWNVTELPYYVTDSSWITVKGYTLFIGDDTHDVVVKFNSGIYLEIQKTGNLELGPKSILTCWKDNDHGEDIWNGEDVGDVEWGDWEGVTIGDDGYNNPINKDITRVWYNNTENYPSN